MRSPERLHLRRLRESYELTCGHALDRQGAELSGEHKDWHDWSFQLVAYMGSANPKCIEALKAAAQREMPIASAGVDT